MSDSPTGSGLDLARQALAAYQATAKTAPAPKAARRSQRTVRGGERRDPVSLGSALTRVSSEQGWQVSLGGGDILDRWATLCPQYADTVRPDSFDAERGALVLRPDSYATATALRLFGGQLAKQINDKLGRNLVARIRILPIGSPATSSAQPAHTQPDPATPTTPPPPTRRTPPPPGYLQAVQAVQENRPSNPARDPLQQAAADRQTAVLSAPGNREPAGCFTDAVAELERLTPPDVDATEQSRQAAIIRKYAGDQPVRRALDIA
ncbi:DUF721 domain-containing protein [Streptomyces rectiviolaceus]|uniref:DUF721 domain-containing protein n=1 Tax=Streptomyces rectiviolaceus TaxID=332591 RepID=A0ABP6NP53_9ACTN